MRRSKSRDGDAVPAAPRSGPAKGRAWRRRSLAMAGLLAATVTPALFISSSEAVQAPVGQGFTVTPSDLSFVLKQIKIAERHSATLTPADPCGTQVGPNPNQIPDRLTAYGLRTVDGSCNNLFPGREKFAAADVPFPRLTTPNFRDAEPITPAFPVGPPGPTSYKQKLAGNVVIDSQPRLVSNLIVDQTSTNPAAVDAALNPVRTQGNPPSAVVCTDPANTTPAGCVPPHRTLFIPNVTTDVGLSPPYNSLFTFFGQFFDHGVDQTVKGGGTVFVPLKADDPLRTLGPDGKAGTGDEVPASQAFMVLTRAQNQPGPDGVLGTADDVQDANNTDSPWVDNSQTYTSHSSHQVFLREYALVGGKPVATGKLLGGGLTGVENGVDISARHNILQGPGDDQGISTWESVKVQARDKLGLDLHDLDVLNVPMIAADPYGNYVPGPARGLPQYVTATGLVEGNLAAPVAVPANVLHFDTPFLTDIAHNADPSAQDTDHNPATPPVLPVPDVDKVASADFANQPAGTYDDEMLNTHFSCGDGRCNENIALSTIHQVFHSEHDRLIDYVADKFQNDPAYAEVAAAFHNVAPNADDPAPFTYGARLFQVARFINEMEYQHLVFEEFARKVQPAVRPFHVYSPDINPAVEAEFAHAVYRFGHSMLDDDVARTSTLADGTKKDNSLPLLTAFLNPPEFTNNSVDPAHPKYTPAEAAGAIVMGSSDQVGNELDEFVTEVLRNNLLGLPLDLATLNLTRARDAGVPPLNDVRRQIFAATNDGQLTPYTSWSDFGQHLKHPMSLINFVAAYGTHPSITGATTAAAKRDAARAIVNPLPTDVPPADAADFMFGTGAWADVSGKTTTGLDEVDLWVGGLAEVTNLNGGLLGSTFNYVFQTQLEKLQDGDRLYYLNRTPGMNLRTQLEGNSFSEIIQRNTDGTNSLKADAFATADCKFQLGNLSGTAAGFTSFGSTVADDPSTTDCDESKLLLRKPDGTIQYRLTNTVNPPGINGQSVYNGTSSIDRIFGGNDNDTFWGGGGNDVIEGNNGDDVALGGDGNDIITDLGGADVLKGGPGNDAIDSGIGNDITMGGDGQDFINGGANDNEHFAGPGNDFIIAGQGADTVFGDGGDDWIQGGSGQDLLQGDHGAPFFDDPGQLHPGNDIFIGQVGENDYDAEGGDDVMAQNAAIDRNAGAAGFDWAFHQYDTVGADDDMNINNNLIGLPVQVVVNRDRWQETEADSGSAFDDIIKGTDVAPATIGGAGFVGCDALDPAGVARIKGLDALVKTFPSPLAPIVAASAAGFCPLTGSGSLVNGGGTVWGEGDILIGGAGSDQITGRGANDIIDGDRFLSVAITVRTDPANPATEIGRTDLMEHKALTGDFGPGTAGMTLQQAVFAGLVDPGNLVAVREIQTPTTGLGVDTAVFRSARSNYTITQNADGSTTVTDNGAAGKLNDGTDTLWNIELLQFTDQTIPVAGAGGPANAPATGAPAITGTARVGLALTATNGTIADTNGITLVTFAWEQEGAANVWTQVGTGSSFTPGPAQVGHRLRVVATVLDNLGGTTTGLASTPTVAVAPGAVTPANQPATGSPVITDVAGGGALAGRPRVGLQLGVDTSGIADPNGLVGVTFNAQWQRSPDGTAWTDIPGATSKTFTPSTAQLGDLLRVHVFFTDQGGSLEQLNSAPTRDVRAAKGKGAGLVLAAAVVPANVAVASITTAGVPVALTAPPTTRVLRVQVFTPGGHRPVATVFMHLKAGRSKVNLRHTAIGRVLRRGGKYRLTFTPGASRSQLGRATVRWVTVHRR
jgi:Ca2+-binding RTX toxin-like protein